MEATTIDSKKRKLNQSKRSLYTKGQSDSEENNTSSEKAKDDEQQKQTQLEIVPSPPRFSQRLSRSIKVVSPPPARVSIAKNLSDDLPKAIETHEDVNGDVPPPQEFLDAQNEEVFKMPIKPAPKTKGRKRKNANTTKSTSSSLHTANDAETDNETDSNSSMYYLIEKIYVYIYTF